MTFCAVSPIVSPRLVWCAILFMALTGTAQLMEPVRGNEQTMSLDVKDTDLRDAIRMISKGYDINIVLDKDVSGKVTVHLVDVPIMEGLRSLVSAHGYEVVREGSLYRIRDKTDESRSQVRYVAGKLTIDVQNVDVREFIRELSAKTALSIVLDSKVSGTISGKLYQVEPDDGIRALLEGNGFRVMRRRNIYQVSTADNAPVTGAALARARRGGEGGSGGSSDFFVDYSNDRLTIEVSNGDLEDVVRAITEQTDVEIVTYGSIKSEVNAKLYDKTLSEAFALLLGGTRFTFVEKDNIILIGDRNAATPSGQALSKTELIHLRHIKADAVPQILPKDIPANNVKVIKEQNALLVSGTSEDIALARQFLETIDIPTPQVRIDAVIVEYKNNIDKEFGVRFWRQFKQYAGGMHARFPGEASTVLSDIKKEKVGEIAFTAEALKKFLSMPQGIFPNIPDEFFVLLRFMETQEKAKVLARPSIVTLNGNQASINVEEVRYYTVTTGTAENLTSRFQPIKFGIQLQITPWISQGGQITADIHPEISDGVDKGGDYPDISSRSLKTTVRLNDGQTLALGGLIKDKESRAGDKIPLLGDLPIIGALFRYNNRSMSKTNLVIYITPHLINTEDSVDLDRELRDYDVSTMGTVEQKVITRYRELRDQAKAKRELRIQAETEATTSQLHSQEYSAEPSLVSPSVASQPVAPVQSGPDNGAVPRRLDRTGE